MRPHRGNALVIAAGATLVLVMLWAIVASTGDIPGDVAVQRWVADADITGVAWWIPRTISFLGGPIVGTVWTVAFVAIVWPWLGWRCAALIAACAVVVVIDVVIKAIVDRPRPGSAVLIDPSFPSGHTSYATAVMGMMVLLLLWQRRRALAGIGIAFIVLMGPSRILVGAHWTWDVVGGYALGLAWLMLVVAAAGAWATRPISP